MEFTISSAGETAPQALTEASSAIFVSGNFNGHSLTIYASDDGSVWHPCVLDAAGRVVMGQGGMCGFYAPAGISIKLACNRGPVVTVPPSLRVVIQ